MSKDCTNVFRISVLIFLQKICKIFGSQLNVLTVFLLLITSLQVRANSPQCSGIFADFKGAILPFKVYVDHPEKRLKNFLKKQQDTSNRFEFEDRHLPPEKKNLQNFPDTQKARDLIYEAGEDAILLLKKSARTTIDLLTFIQAKGLTFEQPLEPLLQKIEGMAASYELIPVSMWLANSRGILPEFSKNLSLVANTRIQERMNEWVATVNSELSIQKIIQLVRSQNKELLNSPEFQKRFQAVLMNAIETITFNAVTMQTLTLRENAITDVSLPWLLDYYLPGFQGVKINYLPGKYYGSEKNTAPPLGTKTSTHLITMLFNEIIKNANEASFRRHEASFKLIAQVNATKQRNKIVVTVEDFGNPAEYTSVSGLGSTSNFETRVGVGIGRFYIYMISEMLGYTVSTKPKPDGSGSITTVEIPDNN